MDSCVLPALHSEESAGPANSAPLALYLKCQCSCFHGSRFFCNDRDGRSGCIRTALHFQDGPAGAAAAALTWDGVKNRVGHRSVRQAAADAAKLWSVTRTGLIWRLYARRERTCTLFVRMCNCWARSPDQTPSRLSRLHLQGMWSAANAHKHSSGRRK